MKPQGMDIVEFSFPGIDPTPLPSPIGVSRRTDWGVEMTGEVVHQVAVTVMICQRWSLAAKVSSKSALKPLPLCAATKMMMMMNKK